MVMSTIHADRAAGAVPRLLEMQVEPYLLTSSLLGVLSQALVRTVCPECREETRIDADFLEAHDFPPELAEETLWRGAGCSRCEGTGYYGRTGIFELLQVSPEIRESVRSRAGRDELERIAAEQGMETMVEDGIEKARQGITTLKEVVRATSGR
jgi:type II secretory ATPase GspE/PulE/Tfp pilus assembly ATPase PilB-like protein